MNILPSLQISLSDSVVPQVVLVSVAAALGLSLLLQVGLVASARRFPHHSLWMRRNLFLVSVLGLALVPFLGEGTIAARLALGGLSLPHSLSVGVELDRLAALMIAMTGFLGAVVLRFSSTYLRNESGRGRFLRTLAITVGLVQLFVLSTSLIGHSVVWMLISWNVHRLLRHYDERPRARLAARKKFLVSRLGDLCLLVAFVLLFREFGTLDVAELTRAATAAGGLSFAASGAVVLVANAALLKSAQFPFQSWLPETMDAPTPVSALMHAGVVNAGAFLLLKLGPLLALSQAALLLLVVVGAVSAALGTVVGVLQPSRKLALAWSTVAQMGFLFFELGLGFAGAAALHLVAHGAYKAHAFLRSGTAEEPVPHEGGTAPRALLAMSASLAVFAGGVFALRPWLGEAFLAVLPLGAVWAIASSQYLRGPAHLPLGLRVRSYFLVGGSVWLAAWVAEAKVAHWFASLPTPLAGGLIAQVAVWGAVALFAIALLLCSLRRWEGRVLEALYVHLLSGLYLGDLGDAIVSRLWPDRELRRGPHPSSPLAQLSS